MYSDKQLDCRGHACAKCGYCRDWYWRPDPNGQGLKIYTKRPNASCIYLNDRDDALLNHDAALRRDNRDLYDDLRRLLRYHYAAADLYRYGARRLCECEDNQS